MSDQQTPAGWYPDPWGAAVPRWWDGTQWTSHLHAEPVAPAQPAAPRSEGNPYVGVVAAPARMDEAAAARVPVDNVWIWLVVVAPVISLVMIPFIRFPELPDRGDLMDEASMIRWQFALFTDPAFIVMTLLGWVGIAVAILAAYRDQKSLAAAGVDRPFPWFFVFLNLVVGPVYAIGRAVVVRRRTGRGFAVLWATIGVMVGTFVVVITWSVLVAIDLVNQIMQLTAS